MNANVRRFLAKRGSEGSSSFPRRDPNPFVRRFHMSKGVSRRRVIINPMSFKLFHNDLDGRRYRQAGTKFNKVITPPTKSAYFMQPLIGNRNFEKGFGGRDRQSTG